MEGALRDAGDAGLGGEDALVLHWEVAHASHCRGEHYHCEGYQTGWVREEVVVQVGQVVLQGKREGDRSGGGTR